MLRNWAKWCSAIVVTMLIMLLIACGGGGSSQQLPVTLTKVTITPATASIPLGTSQQLSAVGTYSDGTSKDLTSEVTWSVSPATVASVSASGMLKSVAKGTATVNAVFDSQTGHSQLTVQNAAIVSMQLSPPAPAIPLGTSQQITATATFTDGTTGDVTSSVNWSATPAADVSILSPGLVRGVGKGSFTVTATSGSVSQSLNGAVGNAIIQSVQVNPSSASIPKGATQAFTATALYSDSTTQDVTSSTTWSSSNTGVASIDGTGTATAGTQGSTQISATYQTFSGAAGLSVSAATIKAIHVTPSIASLAKGTSLQLAASATLTDGSTQDVTNSVSWSSNATPLCTVTSAALTTAAAVGVCTVTATSGAINGSAVLTVTAATLSSITINPPNPSVSSGGSLQLTATGNFSDGSTQNVTSSLLYVSSKPLVANVSPTGLLQGLTPGSAVITASLGSVATTVNVTITAATLQSISLGATITIAAGISTQLSAIGSYSDGSTQDLSATVTWMSSASAVATVNASGNLTGLGIGNATITATLGAISGTLDVGVSPATIVSISINPLSISIAAGQSQAFTALATLSDGSTLDVTASVHWSVTNPLLANISNALGNPGLLTSLIPGSSTVSASLDGVTGTADLFVSAASLVSISVGPSGLALALGVPANLTAIGSYSDGSTQDITASVQWSSSNGQFVSVAAGVVTPIAIGSATVSASMGGVSGNVGVSVTAAILNSINLSSTVNSLALGLTQQLDAVGTYSDGTTQDITSIVHWNSSNTGIVTVSAGGLVLAIGAGNAGVTASLGSVTQTAPISVSAAILESIAVTASQNSFALGFTLQLTATGTYSDGSTQDLTASASWNSSNTSIALVSTAGLISGLLPGGVAATATLQGVSGSFSVTVNAATLVSITISPSTVTLLGLLLQQQFTVTGHFSDNSTQVLTSGLHWSCTNALLGSINSSGLLTALGLGNLNAVASYGGLTATAAVKIL